MPAPHPFISNATLRQIAVLLTAINISAHVLHAQPQKINDGPARIQRPSAASPGKGAENNKPEPAASMNDRPAHYVRAIFNDLKSGSLAGQSGGEGFAPNSAWSVQGAINLRPGDLQLPESNGRAYIRSQNGTPFSLGGTSAKISQAIRPLAVPMKGQVWFRFLVNPQNTSGTAGIKLLREAAPRGGCEIAVVGSDLVVKIDDDAAPLTSKNAIPLGRTSVVLGRIDVDPDQNGERALAVWVNPEVEKLESPLLKGMVTDDGNGITHLALLVSADTAGASKPLLDEAILSNYSFPAGFYHVAPRKVHFGKSHIPIKVSEKTTRLPPAGYKLVFSDEFNVNELDQTKWNYRLGDKADSAQEQENVEVRDGNLLVHARKQKVGKYEYTGGGVVSKPVFVYGYYEARFKIPAAEGWHTAFWTMPVYEPMEVRNTELDFCEQDSGDPHYFSLGVINHREKGWNAANVGRWVIEDAPNMVDEFIVIAAEFTPEYIRFYMNGRLAKEVDSKLFAHGPATVQLSCIASKKKGDRFQDDARLPSQATFDYVRVYQNPKYAKAEAEALTKAILPTKPLPPLIERQRTGNASGNVSGTLD
jgi:beta-glucanase (GH16 family)